MENVYFGMDTLDRNFYGNNAHLKILACTMEDCLCNICKNRICSAFKIIASAQYLTYHKCICLKITYYNYLCLRMNMP